MNTTQDTVTVIDLDTLPAFLGGTLEEKLMNFLKNMDAGINIFEEGKPKCQNGESNIRITTPVEPIENDAYQMLSPLQALIETGKMEDAFQVYKTVTLLLFRQYAPDVEAKEHSE